MKAKILILVSLFVVIFSTNCEKMFEKKHPCPSSSDNITWTSYGSWNLKEEGYGGSSGGDNPADLISDCGWKVDNLQWYLPDTSVIFMFDSDGFDRFQVQEGWTGSTKEGIRMGDDISKFLNVYPYFEESSWLIYPDFTFLQYYIEEDKPNWGPIIHGYVEATFSKDKKLIRLYVVKYEL